MLSIIICSKDTRLFKSCAENIAQTVGVDYEIVAINNAIENLSITHAYNKGASKAQFDNLVFVHEDVIFHTQDWGVEVVNELRNEKLGVLGIAGSSYVPFAPCSFTNPVGKYNYCNIIANKGGEITRYEVIPDDLFSIKALDGVFLATRRNVWTQFKFNENLKGFHGYDLDFSLRVSQNYLNKLTSHILLEHVSYGRLNETYFKNLVQIKNTITIDNKVNDPFNEYSAYRQFILFMRSNNFSTLAYWKEGLKFISLSRFGYFNTFKSFLFLVWHSFNT